MRYWKRLNPDATTSTVESYSHDLDIEDATEISEHEFNNFVASLVYIPPPDPELDRINEILGTSPDVISMPEIWELLRLISHRLGYYHPD